MLRSLYAGISGMRNFQVKLDVIGNNIANVNTVGFKAGRVMFNDILGQTISGVTAPDVAASKGGINPKQIGLGSSIASIDTIHTTGSPMTTNIVTDLSINGNGFFSVKLGTGETFLTRSGNFTKDAAGQLVTPQGFVLLDSSGANIAPIPSGNTFTIGADGTIFVRDAAGVIDSSRKVGLVIVNNPEGLNKVGNNFFQATSNAGVQPIGTANNPVSGSGAIISGQLEMSNVDLTSEFTEMIVAQRGFQANSRIITTSDSILEEVVNLKR